MGANPEVESRLVGIDANLARLEVPLCDRPLQAALSFVHQHVVSGHSGETSEPIPDSNVDLIQRDWFAALFLVVSHWYHAKHGRAKMERTGVRLKGFVILEGMPYDLSIPAVTSRVEVPGQTAWMTFQIGVAPSENPLEWIVDAPDLQQLRLSVVNGLKSEIVKTASHLRQLHCALRGAGCFDPTVKGFLESAHASVDLAANIGVGSKTAELGKGYWELQMLCECALKAVSQVKCGSFRKTHDLFYLYDNVASVGMTFERRRLRGLPPQDQVMSLRYGQIECGSRGKYLKAFNLAVELAGQALQPLLNQKLAEGSFLLKRPPWFKYVDMEQAG